MRRGDLKSFAVAEDEGVFGKYMDGLGRRLFRGKGASLQSLSLGFLLSLEPVMEDCEELCSVNDDDVECDDVAITSKQLVSCASSVSCSSSPVLPCVESALSGVSGVSGGRCDCKVLSSRVGVCGGLCSR